MKLIPKRGRHAQGTAAAEGEVSTRVSRSASRVMSLTVIDQGASSLSNFALAGIVAHFSGAHALGVFAIVRSTFIIGQGIVRSATSDCMLTRHESDDELMVPYEQGGYICAFLGSTVAGGLIALACLFLGHSFVAPMLVLAACLPLIALQDYSRYIAISRHKPGYAIGLDTAWVILFIAAFVAEKKTGHVSLAWLVGAWTVSGAAVGLWTIPRHLNLRAARSRISFFVRSEASIAWKFAGQFILTSSWAYVIQYLMAIVLTVSAIGVFNLAVLAMGPLSVAAVGLQSAMIAVAAKKFRENVSKTLRFIFLVATATAAVTALWMFVIYAVPAHDLKKALGPTWPQARSILLYVGLGVTISQWSGAGAAGLRALRAGKANLWLAVVLVPGLLVPVMVGAELDGLHGAVVGFAIANGVVAVLTWFTLRWSAHRFVAGGGEEGLDDAGRSASAEVDVLNELHPEAMTDPVFGIPLTTPTTN